LSGDTHRSALGQLPAHVPTRTDPSLPRHKAISLFVVDQRAPGVTIQAIHTLGGERTNTVFYDDVRIPAGRLVGAENQGFYYLMEALEAERLMLFQNIRMYPVFERLVQYAKETRRDGRLLAEQPLVRQRLAQLAIELEAALCLESDALERLKAQQSLDYEGSLVKLFGSEMIQRLDDFALNLQGPYAQLWKNDPRVKAIQKDIQKLYNEEKRISAISDEELRKFVEKYFMLESIIEKHSANDVHHLKK